MARTLGFSDGSSMSVNTEREAGVRTLGFSDGSSIKANRTADPTNDTKPLLSKQVGGALAAFSLRDLKDRQGENKILNVRRHDDVEKEFKAKELPLIEDFVNGKQETTPLGDIADARSLHSLRKIKKGYNGHAFRVRRSSDNTEVNVAFDATDKVTDQSPITLVSGTGATSATRFGNFLNESVSGFTSVPYSGIDSSYKHFTSDPTISDTAFSGTNGGTSSRLTYQNPFGYLVSISDFGGCKVKVTGTVNTLSGGNITVKPNTQTNGGGSWTPSEGNKVLSTTGSFEYIFTGNGTNSFRSVAFIIDASTTVDVSNLTFEVIEHGATVHTWYNQSGASTGCTQTNAPRQPTIARNGDVLDHVLFEGSNTLYNSTNNVPLAATDQFLRDTSINFSAALTLGCVSERLSNTGSGMYPCSVARQDAGNRFFGIQESSNGSIFITRNQTSKSHIFPLGSGRTIGKRLTVGRTGRNSNTDATVSAFGRPLGYNQGDSWGNSVSTAYQNSFVIGALGAFDGDGVATNTATFIGKVYETFAYDTDEASNLYRITSNVNNYYKLYDDEHEFSTSTWENGGAGNGDQWDSVTNTSAYGFTASVNNTSGSNKTCKLSLDFVETLLEDDRLAVSFNTSFSGTAVSSDSKSLRVVLRDASGAIANEVVHPLDYGDGGTQYRICRNGFNAVYFEANAANASNLEFFLEVNNGRTGELTISNLRVSRIKRNGFVQTWFDQSGNGNNAYNFSSTRQPYIVRHGRLEPKGIYFDRRATTGNMTSTKLTIAQAGRDLEPFDTTDSLNPSEINSKFSMHIVCASEGQVINQTASTSHLCGYANGVGTYANEGFSLTLNDYGTHTQFKLTCEKNGAPEGSVQNHTVTLNDSDFHVNNEYFYISSDVDGNESRLEVQGVGSYNKATTKTFDNFYKGSSTLVFGIGGSNYGNSRTSSFYNRSGEVSIPELIIYNRDTSLNTPAITANISKYYNIS